MSGQYPEGCGEAYDWLDEWLLTRALEGLDADAEAELRSLLNVEDVDHGHFEEATARFWVGAGDPPQALPPDVAARLEHRFVPESAPASMPEGPSNAGAPTPVSPGAGWVAVRGRHGRLGLGLAASVALLTAGALWLPLHDNASPSRAELAAARTELMQNAPDAVRVDWEHAERSSDGGGVSGYVVWSDARQHGYMTFRDIPSNDPEAYQYRAWLFGRDNLAGSPISIGVFNAPDDADEVIVPIRNRVPVHEAERFGITREPAEAGLYSDDDTLLLLAQP